MSTAATYQIRTWQNQKGSPQVHIAGTPLITVICGTHIPVQRHVRLPVELGPSAQEPADGMHMNRPSGETTCLLSAHRCCASPEDIRLAIAFGMRNSMVLHTRLSRQSTRAPGESTASNIYDSRKHSVWSNASALQRHELLLCCPPTLLCASLQVFASVTGTRVHTVSNRFGGENRLRRLNRCFFQRQPDIW